MGDLNNLRHKVFRPSLQFPYCVDSKSYTYTLQGYFTSFEALNGTVGAMESASKNFRVSELISPSTPRNTINLTYNWSDVFSDIYRYNLVF
jgi:hypothetical protein